MEVMKNKKKKAGSQFTEKMLRKVRIRRRDVLAEHVSTSYINIKIKQILHRSRE